MFSYNKTIAIKNYLDDYSFFDNDVKYKYY